MKHPDEGTVHAWLDGALEDTEAREIEAHVRECAECAAMVAEARGFIAASSRIVSLLDGVPSRVMPPVLVRPVVAGRNARTWWRSPGLAAAALFCITTATWLAVRPAPAIREMPVTAVAGAPPVSPAAVAQTALPLSGSRAAAKSSTPEPEVARSTAAPLKIADSKVAEQTVVDGKRTALSPPLDQIAELGGVDSTANARRGFRDRPVIQLQAVTVASADARAEAAPASVSSNASAPLALVGCYQLAPAPTIGGAIAAAKTSASRAMAGAALAAVAPSAPAAAPTLRLTESQDAYIAHLYGASNTDPARWTTVTPGLVNLTLSDGRTIRVRIAADSTEAPVGAGRVDFIAKRTSCP